MTGHALVDSNVLVYAADASEHERQHRAVATLDQIVRTGRDVLSTQVLGEFFRASTEKRRPPLSRAEAHRRVALMPSFDLAALLA